MFAIRDPDEEVVRRNGWNRVFPEFHRRMCFCEDSDFSSFHFLIFLAEDPAWVSQMKKSVAVGLCRMS